MSKSSLELNFNTKESKKVKQPKHVYPEILTKEISGNPKGKFLFAVVTVDKDDTEDTSTSLWRANSESQLYDLVRKEYLGEDFDDEDEFMGMGPADQFDEDWGFSILFTKIGKFR